MTCKLATARIGRKPLLSRTPGGREAEDDEGENLTPQDYLPALISHSGQLVVNFDRRCSYLRMRWRV